jgi:predicted CopG family antitoxin
MHTIEIDDETYAGLEAIAKQEHASIGSVVKRP